MNRQDENNKHEATEGDYKPAFFFRESFSNHISQNWFLHHWQYETYLRNVRNLATNAAGLAIYAI